MTKSRLEAFSDGVIAVIITIMVLEIKVPQGIDAMVLAPVVPVFLTYVVSFVFVGIYWNNHHHLFHAVHHVNGATLRANLHLLFWLALAPFVTGWAGTSHFATLPVPHTARSYSERPARTTSSLASCSGRTARTHCRRGHSGGTLKGGISMAIYVAAIVIAFVQPLVSCALYVLVAAIWLCPDPRFEKLLSRER